MTQEQNKDNLSGKNDLSQNRELENMFKAGIHFGYSRSKRHPKMAEFLFGMRNNIEVFDLEKVNTRLQEALEFVKKLGAENKVVIFVGTKPAICELTEKYAQEVNMPYVKERWLGGTITNFPIIRKRMDYFEDMTSKKNSGELGKYTKKEQLDIGIELERLNRNVGGIIKLRKNPDALIVVDPKEEKIAIEEAKQKNIPVVAIVNSDTNPETVNYPIPANDDAFSSVEYLLNKITEAYKEGQKNPKESPTN